MTLTETITHLRKLEKEAQSVLSFDNYEKYAKAATSELPRLLDELEEAREIIGVLSETGGIYMDKCAYCGEPKGKRHLNGCDLGDWMNKWKK